MRLFRCMLIASLLTVIVGSAAQAEEKMFRAVPSDSKNLIQFTSKATLETVVGHTSNVAGHVSLNLDSLQSTHDAQFDVDLNSIDTGINMRNNDMRRDFLETAKYPNATFKLSRFIEADKPALRPGETAHVTAEGDFTIHGVTKSYQIPLTMAYSNGGDLTVTGDWIVKLSDHNIQRPQLLFMRLAPEQHVNVRIGLTPAASASR